MFPALNIEGEHDKSEVEDKQEKPSVRSVSQAGRVVLDYPPRRAGPRFTSLLETVTTDPLLLTEPSQSELGSFGLLSSRTLPPKRFATRTLPARNAGRRTRPRHGDDDGRGRYAVWHLSGGAADARA